MLKELFHNREIEGDAMTPGKRFVLAGLFLSGLCGCAWAPRGVGSSSVAEPSPSAPLPHLTAEQKAQSIFLRIARDEAASPSAKHTVKVLMGDVRKENAEDAYAEILQLDRISLRSSNIEDLSPFADFQNVKQIYIEENKVRDLAPLMGLRDVTGLRVARNVISDISPLKALSKLEFLRAAGNQISDLTPLSAHQNLFKIDLADNAIKDMQPICNLPLLHDLNLSGNLIADIVDISDLTDLRDLNLSNNRITDIEMLRGFASKKDALFSYRLDLSGNKIASFGPIESMRHLGTLTLSNCGLTDIGFVGSLTELPALVLSDNSISDISPIENLVNLFFLDLRNNRISDISPLLELTEKKDVAISEIDLRGNPIERGKDLKRLKKKVWRLLLDDKGTKYLESAQDKGTKIKSPLIGKWRSGTHESEWGAFEMSYEFRENGTYRLLVVFEESSEEDGFERSEDFLIDGDMVVLDSGSRFENKQRFQVEGDVLTMMKVKADDEKDDPQEIKETKFKRVRIWERHFWK